MISHYHYRDSTLPRDNRFIVIIAQHYTIPKFLLLSCTAAWSKLLLSDWCKSLPKYCLTWLGQCTDSDLLQMFWVLGILLVVPDNLCGVLIPQLTIIPCSILTICGPHPELEASDSIDILVSGEKMRFPGTSFADTAHYIRSALASWDRSRCTLNFSVTADWKESADGTEFINLCRAL